MSINKRDIVLIKDSTLIGVVLKVHDNEWASVSTNVSDKDVVHQKVDILDLQVVGTLSQVQFERLDYHTYNR